MVRRTMVNVGVPAVAAFGLALALFYPASLQGDERAGGAAQIDLPALTVDGCRVSVRPADGTGELKPGDVPAFELVAVNPGQETRQVRVRMVITSVRPTSPLARMLPRPATLWQKDEVLAVAPGQTATVKIEPGAPLPAGRLSVALSSGAQAVVGFRADVGVHPDPLEVQVRKAAEARVPGNGR